jgi:hypothetical protein
MPHLLHWQCLGCGKIVQAAAGGGCGACGHALCALGRPPASFGRLRPRAAQPIHSGPSRAGRVRSPWPARARAWARPAWAVLGLLALAVIGGEVCMLEAGRRADAESLANDAVRWKIEAAKDFAAGRHWHEAARALREALTTEGATDLAAAHALLTQVNRSRAAALLSAAETAVQSKDVAQARTLLQAYLTDADATDKDRAARLGSELELATSAERAADLLRGLPDEALSTFADGGRLPALDKVQDGVLREVYVATLRAQLTPELHRRAALRQAQEAATRHAREEAAQSEARVRGSPAYRELLGFVAATRHSQVNTADDPRLLAALMQELDIQDPAAQAKTLAELTGQGPGPDVLRARIARERAALKERFRSSRGFDEADRRRFEQLVDRELDRLLRELAGFREQAK